MKKIIFLALGIILLSAPSFSQYRINKTKYDYRTYTWQEGDRYYPPRAGFYSFLLSGLGQMLSGAGGRGAAFLIGSLGSIALGSVGISLEIYNNLMAMDGEEGTYKSYDAWIYIGLICWLGIKIGAIGDAIRVAKVNNLALRDQNKSSFRLKVRPFLGNTALHHDLTTGLTVSLTF